MNKVFKPVSEVLPEYSGLCRTVLEYSQITARMVSRAKEPGFSAASWQPLAELVDTAKFERVGNFKEVMDWESYVAFLTGWAPTAEWDCSFKRITEHDGTVFLELEERSRIGDYQNAVNSLSVYEFTAEGKIHHIDVYLQMELPPAEMLQSYEGMLS